MVYLSAGERIKRNVLTPVLAVTFCAIALCLITAKNSPSLSANGYNITDNRVKFLESLSDSDCWSNDDGYKLLDREAAKEMGKNVYSGLDPYHSRNRNFEARMARINQLEEEKEAINRKQMQLLDQIEKQQMRHQRDVKYHEDLLDLDAEFQALPHAESRTHLMPIQSAGRKKQSRFHKMKELYRGLGYLDLSDFSDEKPVKGVPTFLSKPNKMTKNEKKLQKLLGGRKSRHSYAAKAERMKERLERQLPLPKTVDQESVQKVLEKAGHGSKGAWKKFAHLPRDNYFDDYELSNSQDDESSEYWM